MAYSDKVVEHYENPRNVGSFAKGDETVGTGMVGAPACGDVSASTGRLSSLGRISDSCLDPTDAVLQPPGHTTACGPQRAAHGPAGFLANRPPAVGRRGGQVDLGFEVAVEHLPLGSPQELVGEPELDPAHLVQAGHVLGRQPHL